MWGGSWPTPSGSSCLRYPPPAIPTPLLAAEVATKKRGDRDWLWLRGGFPVTSSSSRRSESMTKRRDQSRRSARRRGDPERGVFGD